MAYTQAEVNQLVQEAAAQAGGTLSYADVANAAANLGISASQIDSAVSTGVITGAPSGGGGGGGGGDVDYGGGGGAPVMPQSYNQAYVNQLVREAAAQAGGTLSYEDALRSARNLGIPTSMIDAALSGGLITGAPTETRPVTPNRPLTPPPVTPRPAGATPTMPRGYDQNFVNQLLREAAQQAGGTLSYADALRAAQNLGIPQNMLNSAMRTGMITESVTPFANATQGMQANTRGTYTSIPIGVQSFNQNFQNYMNTPLGAQYNPGVTGGVSPYGAVMNQMQEFRNPYAGVIANQPIGGYNPNIYDAGLYDRVVQERAAKNALQNAGLISDLGNGGGSGGDSGVSGGSGSTTGGGGMSNQGEGGPDGIGGWYNGGLIDRVSGQDPAGPDEGQINAQVGEYVVKKSAVNKYGKGLLDMINDGKIPAKKMKSLLG